MSKKNDRQNGKGNKGGKNKNGTKGTGKRKFDDVRLTKTFAPKPKAQHDRGSKYRLVGDPVTVSVSGRNVTVHRIEALRTFYTPMGTVREGTRGGCVAGVENLSQLGNCWLRNNAMAIDGSSVTGDAQLLGNACIMDSAVACGNAKMFDRSCASGSSRISGSAEMHGRSKLKDDRVLTGTDKLVGYETRDSYVPKPRLALIRSSEPEQPKQEQPKSPFQAFCAELAKSCFFKYFPQHTIHLNESGMPELSAVIENGNEYYGALYVWWDGAGFRYRLYNRFSKQGIRETAMDCTPEQMAFFISVLPLKLDSLKVIRAAA